MTVHYLSGEEILVAGSIASGFTLTVGEPAQFEANVARPATSMFGEDAFPELWTKAAALLHAFATTQTLLDGNKRTAWAAAWTFLIFNGEVPLWWSAKLMDVYAERFMLQVAAGELTVEQIATRLREQAPRY
ncbi:hypothetical protein SEA_MORGANA_121 [Gordonia phage Morgana]|uniref:Fido domain-containing protein n=1 Tax=Gordonia phage Morgana TaxID=3137292 RepID=A0AAX4RAY5_9CAUD